MRLTTQSEYALICLKFLCHKGAGTRPVSVEVVADEESMSKDYLQQIFLKLKRAGILRTTRGVRGGYCLARDPSEITVKEVIEALEGNVYDVFCSPEIREKIVCMHFSHCSLRPVWLRFRELADQFFSKITLAMLLKDEAEVACELGVSDGKIGKGA